jgi:hypothetical protein
MNPTTPHYQKARYRRTIRQTNPKTRFKFIESNNTMSHQYIARRKIEQAIRAIDETLHKPPIERFSVTSANQLEHFKERLLEALVKIMEDNVPDREYRELGIAKLITDQWPYSLALGATIVEAEQAYKAI